MLALKTYVSMGFAAAKRWTVTMTMVAPTIHAILPTAASTFRQHVRMTILAPMMNVTKANASLVKLPVMMI
jgi:hypothetical protein